MRVSTMVRWTSFAAVLALVAACGEAPTAAAPQGSVAVSKDFEFSHVLSAQTFDIVPGKSTLVSVDGNYVYIQADALCAAGSGYGRAYFDKPCARETGTVTIAMVLGIDLQGNPLLSFSKDVRFSPDKVAYVILKADKSANKGAAIRWWDPQQFGWVDEGSYDPSQKTYWLNNGTALYRRLKHFSGYNVGVGANCDPMVESCDGGPQLGGF